jgi:trigger factor
MGQTIEELKASRKEDAERTVKTRLVLEAIVTAEKLEVTDKDLEDKYNEGKDSKKTIADIKNELKDEQFAYFENGVLINKLMNFLKSNNNL